jgi:hypothetical protein
MENVDRIQLAKDRDKLQEYCEHDNEHSHSIKCWVFLKRLLAPQE